MSIASNGGALIGYLTDKEPFGAAEMRFGLNVDVSRFASLHFQFHSDLPLEVEFQASNDGVNWIGYSIFSIVGGGQLDEYHATNVHGKWFRLIVVNAGGATASYRQYVYGSYSEKELNVSAIIAAALKILADTTDVQVLNPLPLEFAIGIGQDAGLGANSMYINGVVGSKGSPGVNDAVYGFNAQRWGSAGGNTSMGYQAHGGALGALGGVMSDNVAMGERALSFFETGADNVFIGATAGRLLEECEGTVCIGSGAGSNGDIGDNNVIVGSGAGVAFPGGDGAVLIGANAGNLGVVGADSVSLGRTSYAPRANQVCIGADCVGDALGVDGRLAFGANMETPTAISDASEESLSALINMEWNGVHYRVPALSATATDLLPSLWYNEGPNFIAPVDANTSVNIGSTNTTMPPAGFYNMVASSDLTVFEVGSIPDYCSVIASSECIMDGRRSNYYTIQASQRCEVRNDEGNGGAFGAIISCRDTTQYRHSFNTTVSCDNMPLHADNQGIGMNFHAASSGPYTVSLGGEVHTTMLSSQNIAQGQNNTWSLIKGTNYSSAGLVGGIVCLTDNNGPTTLPFNTSHQFQTRFSGGYNFYTTNAVTVGVSLAPGANSWAPLCDVNAKENVVALDNAAILAKALLVPACNYNYIGNPVEQVCYGPTAQDWHAQFGAADIQIPIEEGNYLPLYDEEDGVTQLLNTDGSLATTPEVDASGNPIMYPVLDGNGDPTYETKAAKDPLRIEEMDFMGVLLSCVKGLNDKIEALEARVVILEP